MKINPTVVLTLFLLAMMFGAGAVSASWGLSLGKEALKGITQPDVRPTSNRSDPKGGTRKDGVVFLKEEKILENVKAQIEGKKLPASKSAKEEKKPSSESTPAPKQAEQAKNQPGLPIVTKDRGVTLEVRSVQQQGGSLMLNVSLKNQGDRSVQFLYSFLNVTDDRGRALSASTEGLPGELPPNNETFSGTVSIPNALLEKANKLSLTLTDYPDQQLQLKMSDIPVVR